MLALLPALLAPIAHLGPSALGADDRLDLRTEAIYTVDLRHAVVHVRVDITATNRRPPTATTLFYFDRLAFAVQPDATHVAATQGGRKLAVSTSAASRWLRLDVRLVRRLAFGQQAHVRFTYDLPGSVPRAKRLVRVLRAYVDFVAWAYGDRGSVRVILPTGFQPSAEGERMARRVEAGLPVLRADAIANPARWAARIVADAPAAMADVTFRTPVAGVDHEVIVRSWPDDRAWRERTVQILTSLMPRLDALFGWAWSSRDQPLVVSEVAARALEGYAGMYQPGANSIRITEALDPLTIAHETVHAWLNDRLFADRFITEGLADAVSSVLLEQALGIDVGPAPAVSPRDPAHFPLATWAVAAPVQDTGDQRREAYGYNASRHLAVALVDDVGLDRLSVALRAAAAGDDPYGPPGTPRGSSGPADWHYFLDLLDERAGARSADSLFRTWVAPPGDALEARSAARTELDALRAAAPGRTLPAAVRRPMGAWQFADARAAIVDAGAAVQERAANDVLRTGLGLAPLDAFWADYAAAENLPALLASLQEETAALQAVQAAQAAAARPRDVFTILGLSFGGSPDAAMKDASAALAGGRWSDARQGAATVAQVLEAAPAAGQRAVAASAGAAGAVIAGAGIAVAVRRRRRRTAPDRRPGGAERRPGGAERRPPGPADGTAGARPPGPADGAAGARPRPTRVAEGARDEPERTPADQTGAEPASAHTAVPADRGPSIASGRSQDVAPEQAATLPASVERASPGGPPSPPGVASEP